MANRILKNPFHYLSRSSTLIKHFILRFINNETLIFDKPRRVNLIALLSLLTVSVGFFSHLRLRLFLFGLKPDTQKIWLESTYFLTILMALAGILFTIMWDNLSLDHRDYDNLLILPLRPNILFVSKFLSIVVFVAMTTVILNFFSTLIFSFYLTRQLNINPVKFGLIHLLVHFLGYLFIFLIIALLQALVKNICKEKWVHKISSAIQIILLAVFISAMVWFPFIYPILNTLKSRPNFFKFIFPPLWFIGFGEKIAGNHDSMFSGFTYMIVMAFTILIGLYLLTMPGNYRKFLRKRPEKKKFSKEKKIKKFFQSALDLKFLKNSLEKCSFYFSLKTLNRCKTHKILLLKFWIVPLMVIFVVMTILYVKFETSFFKTINLYLVSSPLFLIFFLVMGIRTVIAYPVNQAADWIFQINSDPDKRHFVNGLKKAFTLTIIIPVVFGFYLIYSYLWGFTPAANHTLFTLVTSMLLLYMVFLNSARIPFISIYKNSLKFHRIMWPFIFTGALLFSYFFSKLGIFLIRNPEYYILYYSAVSAIYFLSKWIHYYHFRELIFTYNTVLEKVIVGLDLDPKKQKII
jgi:hypothetical protein